MEKDTSIRPKKSLGQHFLKDPAMVRRIADAAGITGTDQVIEIGPGLGHLTRELAGRAGRVLAVELDDRLVPLLRQEFSTAKNVEIIHADALEFPFDDLPGTWKVVANLPYYISTPIIRRLLELRNRFTSLTLMLQKEVAERIGAVSGGKEYGFLTVLVQLFAEARMQFLVPAGAFSPRPKVDSAVITLFLRDRPVVAPEHEEFLLRVVKAAFSQRRKTLRNALKQLGLSAEMMDRVQRTTGIDLGRRAETLNIRDFCVLADRVQSELAEKQKKSV